MQLPKAPAPRPDNVVRTHDLAPAPTSTADRDDAGTEMSVDSDAGRSRRRRRWAAMPGPDVDETSDAPVAPRAGTPAPTRQRRSDPSDRALRGLVTTRGTQVSWSAATRARVAAVPTPADIEAAEQAVAIVRRNYMPTEPLKSARNDVGNRIRRTATRGRQVPPAPGRAGSAQLPVEPPDS